MKPKKIPNEKIPTPPSPPNTHLTLSFKYFDHSKPFVFPSDDRIEKYPFALLERFQALCGMTPGELRSSRSSALRSHPIEWSDTSRPDGFDKLNDSFKEQITAWQFTISANEYGRIHGFWLEDVYYVVWIDPDHELYPSK